MHHPVTSIALVVAILVLGFAASVDAQAPVNPVGTYATEWAEFLVFIGPMGETGTRTVEVVALDPEPGGPAWSFRDRSTGVTFCWAWTDGQVQCEGWLGRISWIDYPGPDGSLVTQWFVLDLESASGHAWGRRWELGTREPEAPPPPAVTFNLGDGARVAGTVAVRMTANGLGAGGYRWYISVDGRQVAYRIESTAAITWWWNTGSLAPGTHVLSVRVVDANGREARGRVNVTK